MFCLKMVLKKSVKVGMYCFDQKVDVIFFSWIWSGLVSIQNSLISSTLDIVPSVQLT